MSRRTLKPSDLGVWDYDHPRSTARWVWRYDPADVAVVDRVTGRSVLQPPERGYSRALLVIDASSEHWATRTTRGTNGRGGTRHAFERDLIAAQANGLRWLDRRFKVELPAPEASS